MPTASCSTPGARRSDWTLAALIPWLDCRPDFTSSASVVPHYFGDTNLVNGKVWPVMEVEPRKYRFRMLNGANSRFYDLQLDADAAGTLTFHQIGSDGGLLEAPTDRSQMLMAPAERSDVIVDFSSLDARTTK